MLSVVFQWYCFLIQNVLFYLTPLPGVEWEIVLLLSSFITSPWHPVWARGCGGRRQTPQSHPAVAQTPQWLLHSGGSEPLLQQSANILARVNRPNQVRSTWWWHSATTQCKSFTQVCAHVYTYLLFLNVSVAWWIFETGLSGFLFCTW